MLCVVPMHVGTWPLFMTWGFSLCPILRPFSGISSSLLPLLRLLYSYYIICDPNRKCYSSMSGASADYLDTSSSTTSSSTSSSSSSTSTLTSSTPASIEFSIEKARVQICSSHSLECWTPSDFGHWPICIRKHKKESCRMKKKNVKKEEARKNTKFMGDDIMIGRRRVRCIFNCTKKDFTLFGSIKRRELAKRNWLRSHSRFELQMC